MTETTRSSERVVVIGGGVIGVCAAHYLREAGARVTLVERGEIASGSSYGNAGLIVPSHSVPLAAPGVLWRGIKWMRNPESPFYIKPRLDRELFAWLWRFRAACTDAQVDRAIPVIRDLSRASLALFEALAKIPGLDFGFRRDGLISVYRTEAGLADGRHEAHVLESRGIVAKVLDGRAARDLEPALTDEVVGVVHFPDDAHLTPDRFVRGLARVAEANGVEICPSTEVLGARRRGRRVTALDTTRGTLDCDQVVLAAGAWSPALGRELGLSMPIQAAKGYSVTYEMPAKGPRMPMLLGEARVGVTPMQTEHGPVLRFAGTLELAGLDLSVNRRRVDAIRRAAPRYVRLETEPRIVEIWRGLRPCTPDGLPFIGRPRALDNVVVATGHAMIGVSLGPVTGKLVAELVTGPPPMLDVTPLDPDRFGR
jgi:D-amino-acid dehydrogenase